jgi:predicted RNase H-like nuclease
MSVVCGVDGCRGGWVVVYHDLESDQMRWAIVPNLQAIVASRPRPAVIAIDVPIGIPDSGSRECDVEARRRLRSPRSSSVFPVPVRSLLDCGSWEEANERGRVLEGKGVPKQAWALAPKIREVDEAVRANDELRGVVREVHPELCFASMNGGLPMSYRKRKPEGRRERGAVLRRFFGSAVDEAVAARLKGCGVEDLLDALATVWTAARIVRGEAFTVPDHPPRDRCGLRMEMMV